MIIMLLILQAAPIQWLDLDFDLRRVAPLVDDGADVVVTARRRAPDPRIIALPELDDLYLPRAEFTPFEGARLSLDVDQRMLGEAPSNRVMLTLKKKF